jgi:dihydrofolate reductase
MSVNGYIARENREEDFLSEDNYETFVGLANQSGAAVWGRRTHETMRDYGKEALDKIKNIKKIVISRDDKFKIEEGFDLSKSPKEAIEKLESQGLKEVILTGGSNLNSSFARENLIDEIILNLQAVIVGKGLPVFYPEDFDLNLTLKEIKKISDQIVQLHYIVNK